MRKVVTVAIILLSIILVSLRFIHLDADPPTMLAPYGQSVLTDPYLYTWHARAATLFTDNQHDYERFAPLKYTAVSLAARIAFAVAGVSRVTANVASILLCLGGMLFWLLGLRQFWNWPKITATALLLLANGLLLIYGRMPYLENGLIFLSGLTFFIFARYGDTRWGQFLAGAAVAAAVLCGKLFGIFLIVPGICTPIIIQRRLATKSIILTLGGLFAGALAYLLICMGGKFGILWQYHTDTTNLLQWSPFLSQILGPIGLFVSFGSESGLNLFGIGAVILAAVGTIMWLASRNLLTLSREDTPTVFSLVWLITTLVVFFPLEFRPLRYLIVGILPAVTIGVSAFDLWSHRLNVLARPRWLAIALIFLVSTFLITQIISYYAAVTEVFIGFKTILPWCLAGAALISGLVLWGSLRKSNGLPLWFGRIILILLALVYLVTNGRDITKTLADPRYDLKTLNRELSEILADNAVVTGSYAPALTIDNKLDGIFNYLGTVRPDPAFFERFHPTHIISNASDWQSIRKDYPQTRLLNSIIQPVVWSYNLQIVPLPDSNYHPTLIEQTLRLAAAEKYDSALYALDLFDRNHPHNRLSAITRINLHFMRGDQSSLIKPLVDRLATDYPNDLYTTAFAVNAYSKLNLPQASQERLERCNQLNPYLHPRRQSTP